MAIPSSLRSKSVAVPGLIGILVLVLVVLAWIKLPSLRAVWICLVVLAVIVVPVIVRLNITRFHNSLTRRPTLRAFFGLAPLHTEEVDEPEEPEKTETYGVHAAALARNALPPSSTAPRYDETSQIFRRHKDSITKGRPARPVIFCVVQEVGGSGKTSTELEVANALAYHGFTGSVASWEQNPNGVHTTALGAVEGSLRNCAEMLKQYRNGGINSQADLQVFTEFTDMGVPAMLHGSSDLSVKDAEDIMAVLKKYYTLIAFDAENGLTTEVMQALFRMMVEYGVVGNVITNRVGSHPKFRKANDLLKGLKVRYINIVVESQQTTKEDALYKAFEIAQEYRDVPIRYIPYVPQIGAASDNGLVPWSYISDRGREGYSGVAAAVCDILMRGETEPFPHQKEWHDYLTERKRRSDEKIRKELEAAANEERLRNLDEFERQQRALALEASNGRSTSKPSRLKRGASKVAVPTIVEAEPDASDYDDEEPYVADSYSGGAPLPQNPVAQAPAAPPVVLYGPPPVSGWTPTPQPVQVPYYASPSTPVGNGQYAGNNGYRQHAQFPVRDLPAYQTPPVDDTPTGPIDTDEVNRRLAAEVPPAPRHSHSSETQEPLPSMPPEAGDSDESDHHTTAGSSRVNGRRFRSGRSGGGTTTTIEKPKEVELSDVAIKFLRTAHLGGKPDTYDELLRMLVKLNDLPNANVLVVENDLTMPDDEAIEKLKKI